MLVNNPYHGLLYLSYKEALTLELLCVALDSLVSRSTTSPPKKYSDRKLRALGSAGSC